MPLRLIFKVHGEIFAAFLVGKAIFPGPNLGEDMQGAESRGCSD